MKKVCILSVFLLILSCTEETSKPKYLRWVGDIEQDSQKDNPDFELCHDENRVYQYFNLDQGMQYSGEKTAIIDAFNAAYTPVSVDQSGWIRIRFIVNCKGESGRFRLLEANTNYEEFKFDSRITDQLLSITEKLDGWKVLKRNDNPQDYYQYLIFKIENGNIKEILP
jgi:hypothetical protein